MRKIDSSENVRVVPGMVTGRIWTNILFYLFKSSLIHLQVCIVMYIHTKKPKYIQELQPRDAFLLKRERGVFAF